MHFSCLSILPEKGMEIRTKLAFNRPDYLGEETLIGRLGGRVVDVFEGYYLARQRGSGGPHYDFANASSTGAGLLNFTAKWGLVIRTGPENPFPFFSQARKHYRVDPNVFEVTLASWLENQNRFREILRLAVGRRRSDRVKLMEALNWGGKDLPDFEPIIPEITLSKGRGPHVSIGLKIDGLWKAFCMMVCEDLGKGGARIQRCADPNCAHLFQTDRPNKAFCNSDCAHRYHKRMWARKHLPEIRARKRLS